MKQTQITEHLLGIISTKYKYTTRRIMWVETKSTANTIWFPLSIIFSFSYSFLIFLISWLFAIRGAINGRNPQPIKWRNISAQIITAVLGTTCHEIFKYSNIMVTVPAIWDIQSHNAKMISVNGKFSVYVRGLMQTAQNMTHQSDHIILILALVTLWRFGGFVKLQRF